MKILVYAIIVFTSFNAFSDTNIERKINDEKIDLKGPNNPPPTFYLTPLNSPVHESVLRFLLKAPNGFQINETMYKIQNANPRFRKNARYEKVTLIMNSQDSELRVPISTLPPGFYQLFVKIIDRNKKEISYINNYRNYTQFVIDSSQEVKTPDSKINNSTLLGVDTDGDGIRDDVQRWINENYSLHPNLKLALKQYATEMQNSLLNSTDKTLSISSTHAALRAQGCVMDYAKVYGMKSKEIKEMLGKVEALQNNTKTRIEATLINSKNFHGQLVTILPIEEECNF